MTSEQKLNKYYLKKFGWTLAEVDTLFASQGNVCKICGRPPGVRRLNLDHDHWFDRIKIKIWKQDGFWIAEPKNPIDIENLKIRNVFCTFATDTTRKKAGERFKLILRMFSVRGGLCLRRNKGIQMFEDSKAPLSPEERFDNAAKYFREFKSKLAKESP